MKYEQWQGSEQLESFIRESENSEEYMERKATKGNNTKQIIKVVIIGAILVCFAFLIIATRCKCNC